MLRTFRTLLFAILGATVLLSGSTALADDVTIKLQVEAGDYDRENTPFTGSAVYVPKAMADATVVITLSDGTTIPGQLGEPSILTGPAVNTKTEDAIARQLSFIVPKLAKGETMEITVKITPDSTDEVAGFGWEDTKGLHNELSFGDRPVLRYMYEKMDDSNSTDRSRTYKVFHQLYSPSGDQIITKADGGQFTHHRGLFFGFNRITYGDNIKVDTWHCTGDTHLAHGGFESETVGPVLGRHVVDVQWRGKDKEEFANEDREMTVYNVPGGQLVEFATILKADKYEVELRGDPQHAGFQFRASQKVAEGDQQATYYFRPDGKGKPGETRNWPGDKDHADLPWNAMSFVIDGQRYTAVYLDSPFNPKESRYSERTYGRFGSYFEYDLTKDAPLKLNYRIWVQEGEMTQAEIESLSNDFVNPVTVSFVE